MIIRENIAVAILLIVPYGIETGNSRGFNGVARKLLIVPYGIETIFPYRETKRFSLLIVPYGIETIYLWDKYSSRVSLLIVPYGIETSTSRRSGT